MGHYLLAGIEVYNSGFRMRSEHPDAASQCAPGFFNPNQNVHGLLFHFYIADIYTPHEFLLRNGVGKTCLWEKNILFYE